MDEITFLKHLDDADKDLDAFPFWKIFKKACADNPIRGIKKMTPGRQAVIILWEANSQYRGSDGMLKSVPLDGVNIEDKLKEQSADIRREREQLRNKELGLLDSAEFTHRNELAAEQEQLLSQLDERRLAVADITEQLVKCSQFLDDAKKVQQRLAEQAQLYQDQEKLERQSQEVQAWREALQRNKNAESLTPLLLQRQQVDAHYQQSKLQLLSEHKALSILESQLAQISTVYKTAEKNAESIPSLQSQKQELQRLELQVEKLQQAQQRVIQSEKNQLRDRQTLELLQVKVEMQQGLLVELDTEIAEQRLQLQELSGVERQLEHLKGAGLRIKKLNELKNQQKNNIIEQQKYQMKFDLIQMTIQRSVMISLIITTWNIITKRKKGLEHRVTQA